MTSHPHRLAVATGAAAAAAMALVTLPARADDLGRGWEGDANIPDGYVANGSDFSVRVEFRGPPGSNITTIRLELIPTGGRCATQSYEGVVGEGDGAGAPEPPPPETPTTPTSTATTPPPEPTTNDRAAHTFHVDPGCNGTYRAEAVAITDPPGPTQPSQATQSPPLEINGVVLKLAPGTPTGVVADRAADGSVTVGWSAPSRWGPPRDAVGYRVARIGPDGAAASVGETSPTTTSFVDRSAASAAPGTYRYQVTAVRGDGSGDELVSQPAEAAVELAGASTATTGPGGTGTGTGGTGAGGVTTGGRSSGTGPTPFVPGLPTVTPSTEYDPGFDPELDYSELEEGEEQAVPPADAGLFDVSERTPGTGLTVPGAVALCLVVWAGHLRHLARRAAPPVR